MEGYIETFGSYHIYRAKDGSFYCYDKMYRKSIPYATIREIFKAIFEKKVEVEAKIYYKPTYVLNQMSFLG